jgi:hypothetical protein
MKRKYLFLLMASVFMATTDVLAQKGYDYPKHEVSATLGAKPLEHFSGYGVDAPHAELWDGDLLCVFSAEYFYRVKPWLAVGGIAAYSKPRYDLFLTQMQLVRDAEVRYYYATLMPAVRYDWHRRKHFGMYAKGAIGVVMGWQKINYDLPGHDDYFRRKLDVAFQLSPFGLELGSPHVRGFWEIGFGDQGNFFLLGLRCRF